MNGSSKLPNAGWLDWTRPIVPGEVGYPGDPAPGCAWLTSVEHDGYALSRWDFVPHAGTHLDAPAHFVAGGRTIEQIPAAELIGRALVLDVAAGPQGGGLADRFLAARQEQSNLSFLVLRAREGAAWLSAEAAAALIDDGIRLLGTNQHDCEAPGAGEYPIHRRLLGAGVLLLEQLDLSRATPGPYEMIILPTLLAGAEAAPARVLARKLEGF